MVSLQIAITLVAARATCQRMAIQPTTTDVFFLLTLFKIWSFNVAVLLNIKARVGIGDSLNYVRRNDLEGENKHLVIIDILGTTSVRIINLYRSFNPQNRITPKANFISQLLLIREAFQENTVVCLF